MLDIDQPKVSALSKGKLAGFSLERLFRFLNILGQDIMIRVMPKIRSNTKAYVMVVNQDRVRKSRIKKEDVMQDKFLYAKKAKSPKKTLTNKRNV